VLDHNACGSSSGSGVGASANLASVTIGTETDGSVVCPSGVDGDVGIKPTLGEVSRSGVVPLSAMQDTAGPITRKVTDAAAVLSVIGAPDPADPATSGTKVQDFTKVLDANALRGKRIGVWLDPNAQGDPGAPTLSVFSSAVASLTALGATAVPVTLPYQDVIEAILFNLAFLTQFVDPHAAHPVTAFALLAAIVQACSVAYLSVLIFSGNKLASAFRRRKRLSASMTGGVGSLFVGFAVKLATATLR
jgi:amidase